MARIDAHGGPDVIRWVDVDVGDPGPGEVRLRTTAVGLNFIDTYHRSGLYPIDLPGALGLEAVGMVEATGADVTGVAVGDRVGTLGPSRGAYATERLVRAAELLPLPDGVADADVAAILLKGCTAEFLVERCARVQPGWRVLVHAAAGGVGQLLVPWLVHVGATVIAVVGSEAKVATARAAGAHHVLMRGDDIAGRVRDLTDGAGVEVVFDGVGRDTWPASLAATRRRGMIVSYGNASGPVDPVALGSLASAGSVFVTRPTLFDYYRAADERAAGVARLFALVTQGVLRAEIGQRFALENAADAHRAIESGATIGSTVLTP